MTKRRVITVRMTREERQYWQRIARRRRLSVSNMVRAALQDSLTGTEKKVG